MEENWSRASQGPTDAPRRQPQTMHYLYVLPTEHRKSLRSTLLGSDSTRLEWNEPNSIRASATTTIIFPSFSPLERQSIGKATFHPSLRRLLLAGTTFWRLRRQDIQTKKKDWESERKRWVLALVPFREESQRLIQGKHHQSDLQDCIPPQG